MGPLCWGPDWMPITPKRGYFLHDGAQAGTSTLIFGSLGEQGRWGSEVENEQSPFSYNLRFDAFGWRTCARCERPVRPIEGFLHDAVQGNLAEVQMGQLAKEKGQSDAVKSYGQMLVTDHSANNEKAIALAEQNGLSAPTEPSTKQKAGYDKLKRTKRSGVRPRVRQNDGYGPQGRHHEIQAPGGEEGRSGLRNLRATHCRCCRSTSKLPEALEQNKKASR